MWGRNRWAQVAAFGVADAALLALSLYLSFLLRFDGEIPAYQLVLLSRAIPLALAVKIPVLATFRLYRFRWASVGMDELYNVVLATGAGSLALAALVLLLGSSLAFSGFPRSALGIDLALTLLFVGGLRIGKRFVLQAVSPQRTRPGRKTLVVGAGEAGEKLVRAILAEERAGISPVGFLDDDPRKQGILLHGVPVLGPRRKIAEIVHRTGAESVIIAMPSASPRAIRETVNLIRAAGVKDLRILPFLAELYSGDVRVAEVREVAPEDLLRREPVSLDAHAIEGFLKGKRVLVTGAAGSIGSELSRQALRYGAEELVALDIDETGLFNLERDLARRLPGRRVSILVGDVRDPERVRRAFAAARPQVVFHAAAYKHVPMMESFPAEAVKTNVFGTETVAREARRSQAESFVFISTDKAVNPKGVMGATKRVGEHVTRALGAGSRTRCMAVRFGNVLGSRGSVLPTFEDQIRHGGPVTVTHPDMRRYFMTTAEAVGLVLQAAAMGEGGEVFVLDMGEPVRILDLARELIRFHNLEPDRDVPIVFTGIRPGEKLSEELLTAEEGTTVTSHARVLVANLGRPWSSEDVNRALASLHAVAHTGAREAVVAALVALVPTYCPSDDDNPKVG